MNSEVDSVVVLQSFMNLLSNFCALIFTCEMCQHASDEFSKINEAVEQLNWYLYPKEIKQMLPTLMIMVQQPLELKCFGSLSCCRETDKKVSLRRV